MHKGFKSIFGHVWLRDDRSFILSQGILGAFKHDNLFNKSWSNSIYSFEFFFHLFHLEVFGVSSL